MLNVDSMDTSSFEFEYVCWRWPPRPPGPDSERVTKLTAPQLHLPRRHDAPLDVPRFSRIARQRRAFVARGGLRVRLVPRAEAAARQRVRRLYEHRRREPRVHKTGLLQEDR